MYSALNRIAVRSVPSLKCAVSQKAGVLSGPPRVVISKPEKLVSALILTLGVVGPTGYILSQIQTYRHRNDWARAHTVIFTFCMKHTSDVLNARFRRLFNTTIDCNLFHTVHSHCVLMIMMLMMIIELIRDNNIMDPWCLQFRFTDFTCLIDYECRRHKNILAWYP